MEKMKIINTTVLKLKDLTTNNGQIEGLPKNPRFIRDDKFKKLVRSIEDNPEMLSLRELLVYPYNGQYIIIGGNMRYRAMKELKYTECPCKVLPEDTTIEQLKAYTIKDNSGFGEWDFDMLANDWALELLSDCAIEIPEICIEEECENEDAEEDDFDETVDKIPAKCQKGDVWALGDHRLMCGDSTIADDVNCLMGGN